MSITVDNVNAPIFSGRGREAIAVLAGRDMARFRSCLISGLTRFGLTIAMAKFIDLYMAMALF